KITNNFRPRSLKEHCASLIDAANELGRSKTRDQRRADGIEIAFGKLVRPFHIASPDKWTKRLPPHHIVAGRARRESLLQKGWYPVESWGTWLEGRQAKLGFTVARTSGQRIRVVLQARAAPWAHDNRLQVSSSCGASTIVTIPESTKIGQTYPEFLAVLDCTPGENNHVDLRISVLGNLPDPWWGETRKFCVGLVGVLCLDCAESKASLPANTLYRPVSLSG